MTRFYPKKIVYTMLVKMSYVSQENVRNYNNSVSHHDLQIKNVESCQHI